MSFPSAQHQRFFTSSVTETDPAIAAVLRDEQARQRDEIELIASENIVSQAVLEAQGSVLTNKYAEGYPGRRYYNGCHIVDIAENLAIARAKELFGCNFANVQPASGSQANQAVFLALLQPGDVYMGLDLSCGGHLTHGSPVNMSGKWFKPIGYLVDPVTHLIDYDALAKKAEEHKPKLIIAGGSAYAREIDFVRMRQIADRVGAYLMADIAHIAGLIAGGQHISPFPHAHVVTTTTHKTLRSARGAMILTNDEGLSKKINSAVFPGMQGGPLMHIIAGKAVGFQEALQPAFKDYAKAMVTNARALAARLKDHGFGIVSGGTDTHIVLVDLRAKGLTGKRATTALGAAHITCNMNAVPFDQEKPTITSGVRLGTPACTTRGFGVKEFEKVADMIAEVLDVVAQSPEGDSSLIEQKVRQDALNLLSKFPVYPDA